MTGDPAAPPAARERILARVRAARERAERQQAGRGGNLDPFAGSPGGDPATRLARHAANLVPARGRGEAAERVAQFVAMAEAVNATVVRVAAASEVPAEVSRFLAAHNLPSDIATAPDARLSALPWEGQPLVRRRAGAAAESDLVAVTGTFAGIAETGTLMMASFPDRPNTLNFLPDNHVVVLEADDVVGSYEDAWTRLRAACGEAILPRTVAMITGPSRTSDIELVPTLGAHGPRRLHIIIVDRRL